MGGGTTDATLQAAVPPKFRARIVELARGGRSLASLAKELGVTDMGIRNWLRQADLDTGKRTDGLTTDEKQELTRLRKEVARLREERDILEETAAWFAREAGSRKKAVQILEGLPEHAGTVSSGPRSRHAGCAC